ALRTKNKSAKLLIAEMMANKGPMPLELNCFEGQTNSIVYSLIQPNQRVENRTEDGQIVWKTGYQKEDYLETWESIERIHQIIQEGLTAYNLDPRLSYIRFIGESLGYPGSKNPSSVAYGVFQINWPDMVKKIKEAEIDAIKKLRRHLG